MTTDLYSAISERGLDFALALALASEPSHVEGTSREERVSDVPTAPPPSH